MPKETIEEATVGNTEVADKKTPLVKGYKNKTVVYPLAVLQNKVDNMDKDFARAIQSLDSQSRKNVQNAFQYCVKIEKDIRELTFEFKALVNILNKAVPNLNLTDEVLDQEVVSVRKEQEEKEEAEIDKRLGRVVVNRAAKSGDTVKIDYVGKLDGKAFEGGHAEGFHLDLGNGKFIKDLEEGIIGMKAGDKKEIQVTFPKDYHAKHLAGKATVFSVTCHVVKETRKEDE